MNWFRLMCRWLTLRGLTNSSLQQEGPRIEPYRVTRPIQMTAAGRAIMEDGDSFSHRKTLGLDDWDDTLEGGVRHG